MKYDDVMKVIFTSGSTESTDMISLIKAIACLCETIDELKEEVRLTRESLGEFMKKSNIGFFYN